jgi:iron complex outermembrane receptor protein
MNKKLVAMSAISLVLSISFAKTGYAEDAVAAPAVEPAAVKPGTDPASTKADEGKGGVTKKMLGEVIVTSTTIDDRFDSKRGEPSNVSNISGKKVDDEHGKNIVDVLQSVPGVTAEVQSGDSVKIMLRGVEAQRYMGEKPGVAIVIDGVPVTERTGRVNIDLDNIDSIKVIKGGASYLFGEDALSGAVIITTKRGAKMAGVTASAEKGSFNYQKELLRYGFAQNNWVGHIQASDARADDYYDQGAYSRTYVDGKLQYVIDDTSDLSFGFEKSKRAKDSHGTVTGVTNALLDPRSVSGGKDYARMYDVNLGKLNLTYAKGLSDGGELLVSTYQYTDHTVFKSGSSGYLRNASGGRLYTTATASSMSNFNDVYGSSNDNNQTQRGFKSEWRNGGEGVGLMAGLDIRRDEDKAVVTNLVTYSTSAAPTVTGTALNRAGEVTSDSVVKTKTNAVYGETKWRLLEPLTATLNARYDDITVGYSSNLPLTGADKTTSGQKSFDVWSERVGLNYAVAETHEVYSNISTGFRVPTATQLYGSSITPTGSVLANPDLKPEKSWNKEIGLRSKTELFGVALDTDVAIFQLDRSDFILNTGGQYQNSPTGVTEQYQNIGGVRNRGLELAARSDAQMPVSLDVAYTWLDARFTRNDNYWMAMGSRGAPKPSVYYNNTGKVVPRTPKHKLNMTGYYRFAPGWQLTAEANAQSGIYADEVNVVWVGGRSVYNLMLNYDIKTDHGSKWSMFARLDNVFNRYYYSTIRGSSDSNGDNVYNQEDPSIVVNPGRVWTVGATLKF